jgi:hypothetical protein
MLTAYTRDPDNVDAAVAEILGQLNLKANLQKNSVGIMMFYGDFIETGVAKAINDALPFDIIGGTASTTSVPGAMGDIILTLTILTSDDVSFKAAVSAPLGENTDLHLKNLYENVASGLPKKPSLLLTVSTVVTSSFNADEIATAIDEASGGVPLFGTLAFTHNADLSGIYTWFNGKAYADAVTLIGIADDIAPRFYLADFPESRIFKQKAVVTRSIKNCVTQINGIDAITYLETIGLVERNKVDCVSSIPFVITMPDGSRVIRVVFQMIDGQGLFFAGAMPQGCNIHIANIDVTFVMKSLEQMLSSLADDPDVRNLLMFSCCGRKWELGSRVNDEMQQVANRFDSSSVPYMFVYSGGEFCPVKNTRGELVNHFHNFALTACIF